jgi:hypothetical protein
MSSNPRSVVIARLHLSSSPQQANLVICPANYTLIVKSIGVFNFNAAAQDVDIDLSDVTNTIFMRLLSDPTPATSHREWNGWVVMGPGDRLTIGIAGGPYNVWVSGTVLNGVGVIPPAVQTLPGIPGFMPITSS